MLRTPYVVAYAHLSTHRSLSSPLQKQEHMDLIVPNPLEDYPFDHASPSAAWP